MQQKHQKKKNRPVSTKLKWHPGLVAIGLLAGVFVVILSVEPFVRKGPSPQPRIVETRSSDSRLEAKVMDIASKFVCSCGSCGEQPLEICTCPTAIQERQFIRDAVQSGKENHQIVAAVNTTYGWLKPDSVAQQSDAVRTNGLRKALLPPATSPFSLADPVRVNGTEKKIAISADRDEIFSHFQCPCGQCGVDDLKTCSCTHPRGATEVKGFVDRRIAENNATVAQLVDEVEARYGHRVN
ncbi:MAG: hypothetical protein AB1428_02600 [Bacteroidota bacterium]